MYILLLANPGTIGIGSKYENSFFTLIAFLALLTFLQRICSQGNHKISTSYSCQKVFKIFILILIAIFVFPLTAENSIKMELTNSDDEFIDHYKVVAHVNPKVIHQRRSYVPCDLAIMV